MLRDVLFAQVGGEFLDQPVAVFGPAVFVQFRFDDLGANVPAGQGLGGVAGAAGFLAALFEELAGVCMRFRYGVMAGAFFLAMAARIFRGRGCKLLRILRRFVRGNRRKPGASRVSRKKRNLACFRVVGFVGGFPLSGAPSR